MTALISKEEVVAGVATEVQWMVHSRMTKFREAVHHTMSVSPFLIPILYDLHHAEGFGDLGELLLAGHLMIGHQTSFGKLIDEKILPKVFKTSKLDAHYRRTNEPLLQSMFNEIDHVVTQQDGRRVLLSLKASRWTIQLTMAKELNSAFNAILTHHSDTFDEIVVGVFNGKTEGLTDKYDILRGINRGKSHDVVDIRDKVRVIAGREFWAWINGGEDLTQDWVLDGVLEGMQRANCRAECKDLLATYAGAFKDMYAGHIREDGTIDWHAILTAING